MNAPIRQAHRPWEIVPDDRPSIIFDIAAAILLTIAIVMLVALIVLMLAWLFTLSPDPSAGLRWTVAHVDGLRW